jgi:methylmalonyl-CoA/ethylmalonyl-CoA epimerase
MGKLGDTSVAKLLGLPPVSQIGIVTRDMDKAIDFCTKVLKFPRFNVFSPDYADRTYRGRPGNFKMRIAIAPLGPVDLEFIEPMHGETIYDEFLQVKGEGLHHLGFVVEDIKGTIDAMKRLGIQVLQSGKRPGVSFAYMDTEPLVGFIVELIERKK